MPLTQHIRLPVTDDEHSDLVRRAGGMTVTAYLRNLLGLAPRRQGRPPKVGKPPPRK